MGLQGIGDSVGFCSDRAFVPKPELPFTTTYWGYMLGPCRFIRSFAETLSFIPYCQNETGQRQLSVQSIFIMFRFVAIGWYLRGHLHGWSVSPCSRDIKCVIHHSIVTHIYIYMCSNFAVMGLNSLPVLFQVAYAFTFIHAGQTARLTKLAKIKGDSL